MKRKHIVYGGLTLAGILVIYLGIAYYAEKTVQKELDREILKIAQFADIRYDGVKVDVIGRKIRLTDVVVTPKFWNQSIRIEKGVFYDVKRENGVPSTIRFHLEGIEPDLNHPNDVVRQTLEALDLKQIKADLGCELVYDRQDRSLDIRQIRLAADGIGMADLSLRLKNIDPDIVASMPKNVVLLILTLSGVAIQGAEFEYRDDSLMKKVIAASKKKASPQATDYYQDLVGRLNREFSESKDPKVKRAVEQILNFMKNGGKLSIRLAPDKPVAVGKLIWIRDPGQLIDLLGIKIAA